MSTTRSAGVRDVHHTVLSVADLDAALAFFVDVLGMTPGESGTMAGAGFTDMLGLPAGETGRQVFLHGPSTSGQLELIEWATPGRENRREVRDLGLALISFGVSPTTFDGLLERCRAAGVRILGGPTVLDVPEYAPTRLVILEGPEGVPVELMAAAGTREEQG